MTLGDKSLLAFGDVVGVSDQRGVGTRRIARGVASAGGIGEGTANNFIAVRGGERVCLGSCSSNRQPRVSIYRGEIEKKERKKKEKKRKRARTIPDRTDTAVSSTRELDNTRIMMNPIKVGVNEGEKRKQEKRREKEKRRQWAKSQDSAVAGNECVSQRPRCSVCLAPLIGEW